MRSECGPSSSSSRRSLRSNVSLAAAEARAKAEAARTRADYTRRQIEMKVERARLDAMLTAMQEEGEAEAALAAAKALEAAADTETTKDRASIGSSLVLSAEPVQRTEEFVRAHFDHHQDHPVNESARDDPKDYPNEHSHPQNAAVEAQVLDICRVLLTAMLRPLKMPFLPRYHAPHTVLVWPTVNIMTTAGRTNFHTAIQISLTSQPTLLVETSQLDSRFSITGQRTISHGRPVSATLRKD